MTDPRSDPILEKILRNEYPPEFAEQVDLVDPAHPLASQFSAYAKTVWTRLSAAGETPPVDFDFLLLATEYPNAFVIPAADRPVMAFSVGLLRLLSQEDQFAAIMGHEAAHEKMASRFPDRRNSKLEEGGADLDAVLALQKAGYRQRAMSEALALLPDGDVQNFFDVHPGGALRARNAEDLANILAKKHARENTIPTPLNMELWLQFNDFKQPRHISRLLVEADFHTSNPVRQIEIVRKIFDNEYLTPDDQYRYRRVKDLANAVEQIRIDINNPSDVAALDEFASYLVAPHQDKNFHPRVVDTLFSAVTKVHEISRNETYDPLNPRAYAERDTSKPLSRWAPGNAGRLQAAMEAFIEAPDEAVAISQSKIMQSLRSKLDIGSETMRRLRFPTFRDPDTSWLIQRPGSKPKEAPDKPVELPWHRHLLWAQKAVDADASPDVQLGLGFLGLRRTAHVPALKWSQENYQTAVSFEGLSLASTSKFDFERWHFDDLHRIIGLKVSDRHSYWPSQQVVVQPLFAKDSKGDLADRRVAMLAGEHARLEQSQAQTAKAINEADWTLLDRPGWTNQLQTLLQESGLETSDPNFYWLVVEQPWFEAARFSRDHFDFLSSSALMRKLTEAEDVRHAENIEKFIYSNKNALAAEISLVDASQEGEFASRFIARLQACKPEADNLVGIVLEKFLGKWGSTPAFNLVRNACLPSIQDGIIQNLSQQDIEIGKSAAVGLPLGISPNHPYVILTLSSELKLSQAERLEILARVRYLETRVDASQPAKWLIDPLEALEIAAPQSFHDIDALQKSFMPIYRSLCSTAIIADKLAHESLRLLSESERILTRDDLVVMKGVSMTPRPSANEDNFGFFNALNDARKDALVKVAQLETHPEVALSATSESYVILSHNNFLIDVPQIRHAYEAAITAKVTTLTDPADKMAAAQQILYSRTLPKFEETWRGGNGRQEDKLYMPALRDPTFRGFLTDAMVEGLAAQFGTDDGSPGFAAAIIPKLEELAEKTAGVIRFEILSKLADRTEMQQELAYKVRDLLTDRSLAGLAKHDKEIALGEISIERLNRSPTATRQTLNFLRAPLTEQSAAAYVAEVREHLDLTNLPSTMVRPEMEIDSVKLMHRNFWNMSLEMRTLYADKIIFPIKHYGFGEAPDFSLLRQQALDMVLPVDASNQWGSGPKKPQPESQSRINRDVVEAYINACPHEGEQRLMLTALVVANEPGTSDMGVRPGQAAGHVLNANGPAGTKLAQAAANHQAVPSEIREDLKPSMTRAAPIYRWQMWDLVDKTGLQPARIGRTLGSGAYGITVETPNSAITLLRKDVREQAAREFGIFKTAAQNLAVLRPNFSSVIDMVEQAQAMAKVETDMELAARQTQEAAKHYDGLRVKADGITFTFETAKWIDHGKDYKQTAIVKGQHFNDLPDKTPLEKQFKAAAAKALLKAEIMPMLKGGTFDHDRHGGQQRIDGTIIGQFDFGAMSVTPPTVDQKQAFGRLIGQALRDHVLSLGRKSVADALISRLDAFKGSAADKTYLIEVKRGFLAMSGFMEAAGPEATKAIMAASLASSKVDADIRKSMQSGMGILAPLINHGLIKNARQTSAATLKGRQQTMSAPADTPASKGATTSLTTPCNVPSLIKTVKPSKSGEVSDRFLHILGMSRPANPFEEELSNSAAQNSRTAKPRPTMLNRRMG
jgi:hypothetical protein